ncbi:MAG: 50S ribosomal protein L18 [Proteobacteria bacterium]|jgi:large subunit ribosomal protein L18|nr:50S ribosomal protein L18 [Pseudomonadota bacterium]MBU0990641.1 50S ribosomal protein L18 [Pseudomonadota bacterium]MBU1904758.1 50S ribosomal protein L18 [Pseudomonadota bacterium]
MGAVSRTEKRLRRRSRVRRKIKGNPERPRLCVFRSAKNIYAQIIDDSVGRTLAEASSSSKDLRSKIGKDGGNRKGAAVVGSAIGELALSKGVKKIVFDRNGFLYHGRVKALSDAARVSGLEF